MVVSTADSWIGRSMRRREDPPLIKGEGRYAADPNPDGTVHIAIRRAGIPRGDSLTVDVSPALRMPGVLGAWAAGQIGLADDHMADPTPQPLPIRRPVLAKGVVRFEGDAVAVVAAETEYQAHDAADAIAVDMTVLERATANMPGQSFRAGDVAGAFERAEVRVRQRLSMARVCGAAIEPRAALAAGRAVAGGRAGGGRGRQLRSQEPPLSRVHHRGRDQPPPQATRQMGCQPHGGR